jgi:hypothetical protein
MGVLKFIFSQTLLVIGSGSSGSDIVRETSTVAKKVYQTIRTETEISRQAIAQNASNVEQLGPLASIDNRTIYCGDRALNDVDTILFATGYLFSFPFLPFQSTLIKTGQNVHHLNNYLFYNKNPTLSFIGLPMRVAPFSLMQSQAVVVARYLSGKVIMLDYELTDPQDNGLMMTMEREIEYVEKLGAWAEGWTDKSIDHWHSDDAVTGRLSEEWKETRKNMLALRKEYLDY